MLTTSNDRVGLRDELKNLQAEIASGIPINEQLSARWKPLFDAFQKSQSSINLTEQESDLPAAFWRLFGDQSVTLAIFAREMQFLYDHDALFRSTIEDLEANRGDGQAKSERKVVYETRACKVCWRYARRKG